MVPRRSGPAGRRTALDRLGAVGPAGVRPEGQDPSPSDRSGGRDYNFAARPRLRACLWQAPRLSRSPDRKAVTVPNTPADQTDPERGDLTPRWDEILTGGTEPAAGNETPTSRRDAREARTGGDADAPGTRADRRARLADGAPREKKKRRGGWGCLVVLVVLAMLVAGGAFVLQGPISQLVTAIQGPPDYTGTGEKKIVVMINDGDSGADIAKTLVKQDVVKSFTAFYRLLLAKNPAPVFQPGAYQLATKMSASSALDALLNPATRLKQTVVIPEGTVAAVALQSLAEATSIPLADLKIAAADVASFGLPAEATSLEGFLFPATYSFSPGVSAHDAIKTLSLIHI